MKGMMDMSATIVIKDILTDKNIADALGMNLMLKDKDNGKEYIIDYPNERKESP